VAGDPYDAFNDPYCYPGSAVLINLAGLTDQAVLDDFETEMVALRAQELPMPGRFAPPHYRAIHRHLFQDVYAWAGRYRTVRTFKGGNPFCFPEYIDTQMKQLFGRLPGRDFLPGVDSDAFILALASFLTELNVIHPFREGNGRTQQTFFGLLGNRAGHPFRLAALEADPFRQAMVASYQDDLEPLIDELQRMLA
jgi:cell filamentation protein